MPETTLRLDHLCIGYADKQNRHVVSNDLCATLYSGQLTCLLGANGVGKSTLLRTLSAFQPKLGGEILLQQQPIGNYTDKQLARLISVVLTERTDVQGLSVEEMVGLGRTPYTGFWGRLNDADKEVVKQAIRLTGIEALTHRMTHTLSDGERQKVMIAKALAQETPIIFLDEPTAFLDYPSKVEMMQLLHHLSRTTQKTIFLSTHDLELALQIADQLWLLHRGGHLLTGTPEDLLLDGTLPHFFQGKGILFDSSSGTFRVVHSCQTEIAVSGQGLAYIMLCRALQRNGFAPVSPSSTTSGLPHIHITTGTDSQPLYQIELHSSAQPLGFRTVSDCLAALLASPTL